jgi:hypothetical protein
VQEACHPFSRVLQLHLAQAAAAGADPDQEFFRRSKRLQGLEGMFIHQVREVNS